jgi:hypothetical protein
VAATVRRPTVLRSIGIATLAALLGCPALAQPAAPGQTAAPAPDQIPAPAPDQSASPATCDTPQHHLMDFWVGDWQVFDAATKERVALDRIEKLYEGCVVEQHLTFLTDLYRRPGVKVRLAGIAVNRFDGESWLQMWADNQWGAILLRGRPNASGNMEFVSVIPSRHRDVRLVYEKHADGTLSILEYVAPAGSGKWVKYGDLLYRRNR